MTPVEKMAVLKAKLLLSKELKDKWDAAKLRDDEDAAGGVAETTPGVADAIPAETQPEVEAPSTAKLPDDEDAAGGASDVEAAQGAFMAALKPALSVKKKKKATTKAGRILEVAARDRTKEATAPEVDALLPDMDPLRQLMPPAWFKEKSMKRRQGPQKGADVWKVIMELSPVHAVFKHVHWPNSKGTPIATTLFTHQCRHKLPGGKFCNELLCIGRKDRGLGSFRADQANVHVNSAHVPVEGAARTRGLVMTSFFARDPRPLNGPAGKLAQVHCATGFMMFVRCAAGCVVVVGCV